MISSPDTNRSVAPRALKTEISPPQRENTTTVFDSSGFQRILPLFSTTREERKCVSDDSRETIRQTFLIKLLKIIQTRVSWVVFNVVPVVPGNFVTFYQRRFGKRSGSSSRFPQSQLELFALRSVVFPRVSIWTSCRGSCVGSTGCTTRT